MSRDVSRRVRVVGLVVVILWALVASVEAVQEGGVQTKEERLNLLELREAELTRDQAKAQRDRLQAEYDAAKELFDEGVYSLKELNDAETKYLQARLGYEKAEIDLERTKLNFLKDATHISIAEAKQYRTLDGKRMVEITLKNSSSVAQAMALREEFSEEQISALLSIQDIIVSIIKGGSIVGEPYEMIVPTLGLGEKKTLTFQLLQEVDDVVIDMTYLETSSVVPLVLKKEALQDVPTINSAQFSQEGQLNSKINFDIMLERLAEEEKNFRLVVLNLPREFDFSFRDQSSGASLSQVKFTEETSKIQLNLEIGIPEKLSRKYVDSTIDFYVFVTEATEFKNINELRQKSERDDQPIPLEDIQTIKGNNVRLELIPRGIGELEVVISNRYQEIKTGENAAIRIDIHNTGTLAVQNVKAIVDLPYEWESEIKPVLIKEIVAGEKEPVNIVAVPPSDLGVGEYAIQIEAEGEVGNEKVESVEKEVTIRVGARANVLGNALLIGGLILLVLGMVIASIKISRR